MAGADGCPPHCIPAASSPPSSSRQAGGRTSAGAGLCASCDRCRARKVKCDGRRPCGTCVSLHVKAAAERGSPLNPGEIGRLTCEDVGCVYLPAKRRGPMPGYKLAKTTKRGGGRSKKEQRGARRAGKRPSLPTGASRRTRSARSSSRGGGGSNATDEEEDGENDSSDAPGGGSGGGTHVTAMHVAMKPPADDNPGRPSLGASSLDSPNSHRRLSGSSTEHGMDLLADAAGALSRSGSRGGGGGIGLQLSGSQGGSFGGGAAAGLDVGPAFATGRLDGSSGGGIEGLLGGMLGLSSASSSGLSEYTRLLSERTGGVLASSSSGAAAGGGGAGVGLNGLGNGLNGLGGSLHGGGINGGGLGGILGGLNGGGINGLGLGGSLGGGLGSGSGGSVAGALSASSMSSIELLRQLQVHQVERESTAAGRERLLSAVLGRGAFGPAGVGGAAGNNIANGTGGPGNGVANGMGMANVNNNALGGPGNGMGAANGAKNSAAHRANGATAGPGGQKGALGLATAATSGVPAAGPLFGPGAGGAGPAPSALFDATIAVSSNQTNALLAMGMELQRGVQGQQRQQQQQQQQQEKPPQALPQQSKDAVVSNLVAMELELQRQRLRTGQPPPPQQQPAHGDSLDSGQLRGLLAVSNQQQVQRQRDALAGAAGAPAAATTDYTPLLRPDHPDGAHLRSSYAATFADFFGLRPCPSEAGHCDRFPGGSVTPDTLPPCDVSVLNASRLAELAVGALPSRRAGFVGIGGGSDPVCDLAGASARLLASCVREPVHPSLMHELSKSFFLHALIRLVHLDDPLGYAVYRRVSLMYLAQIAANAGPASDQADGEQASCLLACVSYHDSSAYASRGGDEGNAPDVEGRVPAALGRDRDRTAAGAAGPAMASLGHNRTWFQGVPCVYVSSDSPAEARLADALAYLVRSSADRSRRSDEDGEGKEETRAPTRSRSGRDSRPSLKRKFLDDARRERATTNGSSDRVPLGPTERAAMDRPDLRFDAVLEGAGRIAGAPAGPLGGPLPRLSDHALLLRAVRCISDDGGGDGDGASARAAVEASRGMAGLCSSRPSDPVARAVGRNLALSLARRIGRTRGAGGDRRGQEEAEDAYAALRAVLGGDDDLPRMRADGEPFGDAPLRPSWRGGGGGGGAGGPAPANGGGGGADFRSCDEALLGVLRSMR